jgi:glutamate-1-semialdehyde 2,1-aminomutase
MAAGIETLRQLSAPGFHEALEQKSNDFYVRLEQIIAGKDIQLNHIGSMFTLFFNEEKVRNFEDTKRSDQKRFARYFQNMLSRGIYVSPSQYEGNFISEVHTPEILNNVLKCIEESI